jgi:hypothetical protein
VENEIDVTIEDMENVDTDDNLPEQATDSQETVLDELIDINLEILLDSMNESIDDEISAKVETLVSKVGALVSANKAAAELFSKILKGYTVVPQIKLWMELNKAREL